MALAGAGSTMLMVHFLLTVRRDTADNPVASPPLAQLVPWLIVAVASFVIPWSLYPAVSGEAVSSLVQPEALWKVTWPLLLGASVMLLVRRWPRRIGAIPEGDFIVLAQEGGPFLRRVSNRIGEVDTHLRRWPVAGLGLTALAVLLGGALMLRG
jgi:hypothetical protein